MESNLTHDVCEILRWLSIAGGLGTDPETEDEVGEREWPVHAKSEPDKPDNCITIYTTSGQDDGQSVHDGSLWAHYGWQFSIRSKTYDVGYAKANAVRNFLAQQYWETVTVPDATGTGGTDYRVETLTNIGTIIPLGREQTSNRYLFTINGMVTIDPLNS